MAAAAPKVDGQDKVIAAAQHIVKTLATTKNAADDMIRILTGFDNRLSSIPDLFSAPAPESNNSREPDATIAENRDREHQILLESAEMVVMKWDCPVADDFLIFDSADDAADYVAVVHNLISLSTTDGINLDVRSRAATNLQIAMSRFEDELRLLIARSNDDVSGFLSCLSFSMPSFSSSPAVEVAADEDSTPRREEADRSSRSAHSIIDQISPFLISGNVIPAAKQIADLMTAAGYTPELVAAYATVRHDILLECIAVLGADKMSMEDVQKAEWTQLDGKMKRWIRALKIAVSGLLAAEKAACCQIFAASNELGDECFSVAATGSVLLLLNFGDAVAIAERSPEKLFGILGMFEALADMRGDLSALFSGETRDFIVEEADGVLSRLADAVRGTMNVFNNAILRETSRKVSPAGEILPVIRYVMNYLTLLADYAATLNKLLEDGSDGGGEVDDAGYEASATPMGRRVQALVGHLQDKVENKAALYEDEGLRHVFLMNNLLYIVHKVRDSDLKAAIGDDWIRRCRGQIKQHSTGYLRTTWQKVVTSLMDNGSSSGAAAGKGAPAPAVLKEKLRSFNAAFEEIHRMQVGWKVPDAQLRDELKIRVAQMVVPAYRAFIGRYRAQIEAGRTTAKHLKYSPEDIEAYMEELFDNSTPTAGAAGRRA